MRDWLIQKRETNANYLSGKKRLALQRKNSAIQNVREILQR